MEEQKKELPPCHQPVSDDDCCQDQTILLEVEDQSSLHTSLKLSLPDMTFIAAFAAVWSSLFEFYDPAYTVPPAYSPPALAQDIPVLVQSFLL